MKFFDVSRTVQEAPLYPGSAPVAVTRILDTERGDPFCCSMIRMDSHAGTHADAYSHVIKGSPVGIDRMELERYYGPCRVITVAPDTRITRAALEGKLADAERVALRTLGRGYLTTEAAAFLVASGVRAVVTDAPSVAPLDQEVEIHTILLGAGLAIVENAVFDGVPDGDYLLAAFPIKFGSCDGAPVRAVLMLPD